MEDNKQALFQLDGKPSLGQIVPLGLQHVLAAVVGVVTPAILVANRVGLDKADTTLMIQIALMTTAIATLIQVCRFGPVGSRLPVIMGSSFAYVPTLLAIGGQYDLATILGAQIVGGCVAILFGCFVKQIRVLFPSLVTGTVIFTIGLSLYPVAIRYMAGGTVTLDWMPAFGAMQYWIVALITFAVVVFCNFYTKGAFKLASILIGIIIGYIVALAMGLVSFAPVQAAPHLQLPSLKFGVKFVPAACVSMAVMFIVNSVQTIGDLTSTTMGGLDREPSDTELRGAIFCQGVASIGGAFFGGLPTASYSQNVGIVTVNRVVNRRVFMFAALIILIAGLLPKFSALITTIPYCVIGGATLSVFATITMTGIRMIALNPLTMRNTAVVGLSVALGVGITQVQGSLAGFPAWVTTVFGSSSVVMATLMAIILNLVLPKTEADKAK